jgi:hypothetical protein
MLFVYGDYFLTEKKEFKFEFTRLNFDGDSWTSIFFSN